MAGISVSPQRVSGVPPVIAQADLAQTGLLTTGLLAPAPAASGTTSGTTKDHGCWVPNPCPGPCDWACGLITGHTIDAVRNGCTTNRIVIDGALELQRFG